MPKSIPPNFFKTSLPIALVAGGAGFIGSQLCQKLLAKNLRVICLDNWRAGAKENISGFSDNPNFFLFERDLTKRLPASIKKTDYIFHLTGVELHSSSGEVSIEELETNSVGARNLLELAQEKKSRFVLVTTSAVNPSGVEVRKFAEVLTREYGEKRGVDARIVRLGDVYGPRMPFSPANILRVLIKQAAYSEPLLLPADEYPLFPVFTNDAVEGIVKAVFSSGIKSVFLAGPKIKTSEITRVIRRVKEQETGESLAVRFSDQAYPKRETAEDVLSDEKGLFHWEPQVSLEEGIKKTLDWFSEHKRGIIRAGEVKMDFQETPPMDLQAPASKEAPRNRPLIFATMGVFLLTILSPFLALGVGLIELSLVRKDIFAGRAESAEKWSGRSADLFGFSQTGFLIFEKIPGVKNEAGELKKKARLFGQLSELLEENSRTAVEIMSLGKKVFQAEEALAQELADRISVELAETEKQLGFIEADYGRSELELKPPVLFFIDASWGISFDLGEIRRTLRAAAEILPYLPELLGQDAPKKYLVLFQNNAELRPTGGFIGSFALATFYKGRLVDLNVQDVYEADGQLKGHVEPPPPIEKYLGEAGWFLRDSNWSPDFPTSAQRAAWFIDKELGLSIDGVVAVDLELAKGLIAETGEVELPDFGDVVTPKNLYEKTQYAAEGNFFPGSKAKKNFLTALNRAILLRLVENPEQNLAGLGKAFFSALETRHAAIWTSTPGVNSALQEAGWNGSLKSMPCSQNQEGCLASSLQVVEANLGVNKANYFLERNYSLNISVSRQKIIYTLVVSYKNNSQAGVWPGGDYKNYMRLFVPKGAGFLSASLVDSSTGRQEELAIEIGEELGRKTGGMLFVVPAGEARDIVAVWEEKINFANKGEFLLLWQKQMGTPADLVRLKFSLPPGFKIAAVPEPALTQESQVGYNTALTKDLLIKLSWQPEN